MTLKNVWLIFILSLVACGPNEEILKSNSPTPAPAGSGANSQSSNEPVEKEVEAMQTADFNYIFVLRRRDGGVFDANDKTFLRQATGNVNRRTLSDDGKAIIIG